MLDELVPGFPGDLLTLSFNGCRVMVERPWVNKNKEADLVLSCKVRTLKGRYLW